MTEDEALYLLATNALNLLSVLLRSNYTNEFSRTWHDEIYYPKVGDLVLENTSCFRWREEWKTNKDLAHLKFSMGRITAIQKELMYPEEQREEMGYGKDEKMPEEKVFYIDALNGQNVRWTNCHFIKVMELWKV